MAKCQQPQGFSRLLRPRHTVAWWLPAGSSSSTAGFESGARWLTNRTGWQESPLLECRRKDRITNRSAKLLSTKKAKGLHASENGLHASCERRSVQVL